MDAGLKYIAQLKLPNIFFLNDITSYVLPYRIVYDISGADQKVAIIILLTTIFSGPCFEHDLTKGNALVVTDHRQQLQIFLITAGFSVQQIGQLSRLSSICTLNVSS